MAERVKQNQFEKAGVNPFNAPVPGESLTASPATLNKSVAVLNVKPLSEVSPEEVLQIATLPLEPLPVTVPTLVV